jgi:hypothetical protein
MILDRNMGFNLSTKHLRHMNVRFRLALLGNWRSGDAGVFQCPSNILSYSHINYFDERPLVFPAATSAVLTQTLTSSISGSVQQALSLNYQHPREVREWILERKPLAGAICSKAHVKVALMEDVRKWGDWKRSCFAQECSYRIRCANKSRNYSRSILQKRYPG